MDNKIFVIYMTTRQQEKMPVHSKRQVQIEAGAQVRALLFDKALIEVSGNIPIKVTSSQRRT